MPTAGHHYSCSDSDPSKCDQIVIIGYSRGAVAAKRLAWLIEKASIVEIDSHITLDRIYDRSFKPQNTRRVDKSQYIEKMDIELEQVVAPKVPNVRISFLGLFDTVAGLTIGDKHKDYDDTVPPCVDSSLEILAVDERRRTYRPTTTFSKVTAKIDSFPDPKSLIAPNVLPILQIWHPGAHYDIGGDGGDLVLSNSSLLTMLSAVQNSLESRFCNEEVVNKIVEDTIIAQSISISPSLSFRKRAFDFCLPKWRKITDSPSTRYHEVLSIIFGKRLSNKRNSKIYLPQNMRLEYPINWVNTYPFSLPSILPGYRCRAALTNHIRWIVAESEN